MVKIFIKFKKKNICGSLTQRKGKAGQRYFSDKFVSNSFYPLLSPDFVQVPILPKKGLQAFFLKNLIGKDSTYNKYDSTYGIWLDIRHIQLDMYLSNNPLVR